MSKGPGRRVRYLLACTLAGLTAVGHAGVPATVARDPPAVSTAVQARLDNAESLLDAWAGQGSALDEAKAELDRVLRDDPQSANAYRLYARYYLSAGYISGESYRPESLAAAGKALEQALEIAPDYARAYVLQGYLFRIMGMPEEAKAALNRADRLGTDDPWLQINWGDLLMQESRLDEAAARYKKVLDNDTNPAARKGARSGLSRYYKRTNRLDDADALYRADIAAEPGNAWLHGNYAVFLLCWRDDADSAIAEAVQARSLMDYGIARLTLAAALYRKWAALALDGNKLAEKPLSEAKGLAVAPAGAIKEICGGGPAVLAVLEAMLRTGEGERIPAKVAAVLSAEEGGSLPGLFVMQVQASGRDRDRLYLNSELDYRDARNLSVVFAPHVEAAFKREHGSAPDAFLKGKQIVVLGSARQVKVHFMNRGVPTDKYYYQTHIMVAKPEYIRVVE